MHTHTHTYTHTHTHAHANTHMIQGSITDGNTDELIEVQLMS